MSPLNLICTDTHAHWRRMLRVSIILTSFYLFLCPWFTTLLCNTESAPAAIWHLTDGVCVCLWVILSSSINARPVSVGGLISLETSERFAFPRLRFVPVLVEGGARHVVLWDFWYTLYQTALTANRIWKMKFEYAKTSGGRQRWVWCASQRLRALLVVMAGERVCYIGVDPPCVAVRLNLNTEWRKKYGWGQTEHWNFYFEWFKFERTLSKIFNAK